MIFCPIVPYFWTNKNPLKFNWQNPDRYIFQPVEIWLTTQGSLRQTKFFLSLSDISQSRSSKKKWVNPMKKGGDFLVKRLFIKHRKNCKCCPCSNLIWAISFITNDLGEVVKKQPFCGQADCKRWPLSP